MTARRLAIVCVLLGCGTHDVATTNAPRDAAPVPPHPLTAPHSGAIRLLAVTDAGDAALTSDTFDELRLWPTLDGTREPVVVRGTAARDLALGRDGDGFVAAIIDDARRAQLIRLGPDGAVRGRATIGGEVDLEQVVAIPGGVLVRRADQTIERFDSHGVQRGRLAPLPGERVLSLAARRDGVLAAIDEHGWGEAKLVRWIALGDPLAWGDSVTLPLALSGKLALAPGGHRLIGIQARENYAVVIDLGASTAHARAPLVNVPRCLGFLDDDHAFVSTVAEVIWWTQDASPSWRSSVANFAATEIAVGGSAAIAGDGTGLDLIRPGKPGRDTAKVATVRDALAAGNDVTSLGYRHLLGIQATVVPMHDGIAVVTGNDVLWLDSKLALVASLQLDPMAQLAPLVLDDRHVAIASRHVAQAMELDVTVVDAKSAAVIHVGSIRDATGLAYEPETHVLAVAGASYGSLYRLDFAAGTATALGKLSTPRGGRVYLTNPVRAHGVIAVVATPIDEEKAFRILTYLGGANPALPKSTVVADHDVMGVDRTGIAYTWKDYRLLAVRNGEVVSNDPLSAASGDSLVPDHDASRFAAIAGNQVSVVDRNSNVRWQQRIWELASVAWTGDERRVIAVTPNGLVALDASTGARIATGCAWSFGLSADRLPDTSFTAQTVCQDAD